VASLVRCMSRSSCRLDDAEPEPQRRPASLHCVSLTRTGVAQGSLAVRWPRRLYADNAVVVGAEVADDSHDQGHRERGGRMTFPVEV